jgi:nicotinamide-nucleotide amidase
MATGVFMPFRVLLHRSVLSGRALSAMMPALFEELDMPELLQLAEQLGVALQRRGWKVAVAESCTGGWVAKCLTDIAGSSGWFDRGFVTYSNAAKRDMLGVSAGTLDTHGAVSEPTVLAMSAGALARSEADVALAISGIAGPGGAVPGKPVGTVCFAWAVKDVLQQSDTQHFCGDREAVRQQSVAHGLRGLINVLKRD